MVVTVTLDVPDFVAAFYTKLGESRGISGESAMSDILLKMAGELSLRALHRRGVEPEDVRRMADERFEGLH